MNNIKISELNKMSQAEFTKALGEIWEETPVIAQKALYSKPFDDLKALYQAMMAIVNGMSNEEQLTLIKAHPDLGSKAKMAEASVQEQAGVGLDRLSESEYQRFQSLNQAYKDKFDFPFIIAVKEHTKESILQAFETRLKNDLKQEKQQALAEISKIARFRLEALMKNQKQHNISSDEVSQVVDIV
ncbi:MAG: 2-oxo-4-hydroxy-4-carboxy-5-ureidoimidazoline decarboxylase [Pleurocapsa sp.]